MLPALAGTGIVSDREWAFRAALLRGTVLDLSIGGVAFAAPEPIEPGCLLDVEMRHPDRPGAVVRRVRVIDQQKQGNDCWKTHCRFLHPLTFAEVSCLSIEPTV